MTRIYSRFSSFFLENERILFANIRENLVFEETVYKAGIDTIERNLWKVCHIAAVVGKTQRNIYNYKNKS